MIDTLARRLREHPDDPRGWALLGRSYEALGRFTTRATPTPRRRRARPTSADLLADYADTLGMAQGRTSPASRSRWSSARWRSIRTTGRRWRSRRRRRWSATTSTRRSPTGTRCSRRCRRQRRRARSGAGDRGRRDAARCRERLRRHAGRECCRRVAASEARLPANGRAVAAGAATRAHRPRLRTIAGDASLRPSSRRARRPPTPFSFSRAPQRTAHAARRDAHPGARAAEGIHARRFDGHGRRREALDGERSRRRGARVEEAATPLRRAATSSAESGRSRPDITNNHRP